jgi:CheY-like chemotaxis protein
MVSPSASPSYAARFLVIEDELLIALLLEETIREFGYRVSAVARTIPEARREFAKRNFDAVLLDINIDGRYNTEIADLLLRENIPCAFVTGYDYLVEPRHENIPVLPNPPCPTPRTLGKSARLNNITSSNEATRLNAAVAVEAKPFWLFAHFSPNHLFFIVFTMASQAPIG